tara:strand:+ start:1732 stop:2286 length:555 start_codon:yes stop_codon:yes gene_type:complete
MIKIITFFFKITLLFMFFFNYAHGKYEKNFFDFKIKNIDGKIIDLNIYKNKVVLLVNTASFCGFTNQYENLQSLWDEYKNRGLVVIAVPSNSFNQEKDNNKDIKEFCEVNYNINFPITAMHDVKGENAHEIFKWANQNHGKSAIPKWNFHKILINKDGKISDTFSSFTKPNSDKIKNKIEKLLN